MKDPCIRASMLVFLLLDSVLEIWIWIFVAGTSNSLTAHRYQWYQDSFLWTSLGPSRLKWSFSFFPNHVPRCSNRCSKMFQGYSTISLQTGSPCWKGSRWMPRSQGLRLRALLFGFQNPLDVKGQKVVEWEMLDFVENPEIRSNWEGKTARFDQHWLSFTVSFGQKHQAICDEGSMCLGFS